MTKKNNSFGNRKSAKQEGGRWVSNEEWTQIDTMQKTAMAFEIASICHINPPKIVLGNKFTGNPDDFVEVFTFINATQLKSSTEDFSEFYTECVIRGKLYFIHTEAAKNGEVPAVINPLWKGLLENCLHQLPENMIKEIDSVKFADIRIELEREIIEGAIKPVEKDVIAFLSAKMDAGEKCAN